MQSSYFTSAFGMGGSGGAGAEALAAAVVETRVRFSGVGFPWLHTPVSDEPSLLIRPVHVPFTSAP